MESTIDIRSSVAMILICAQLVAVKANGQEIDAALQFNQSFQGIFTEHLDADLMQFEEARGSLMTITALPVGASKVKPKLALLDAAQTVIDTAQFEVQKGKKFQIRKFPAPYSGTYYLRATSGNGDTGLYRVNLKASPPADVFASGAISAPAELDAVGFAARGGSVLSGAIKRKSGTLEPFLVELVGPAGGVGIGGSKSQLNADGTKLTFANVPLATLGEYALRLTGQSGSTGDYKVTMKIAAPAPIGGSVFEPGHPFDPGLSGKSFSLVDVSFGRGLRTADGLSMDVVSPMSLVLYDPITDLPVAGTLAPLFQGGALDDLIPFHLGALFTPPVVPRNGVLALDFDAEVDVASLKLEAGRLGPDSPILLTAGGSPVRAEVIVRKKRVILNPVVDGHVGFPASPLVLDGSGHPVASATGVASLTILHKGLHVLQSTDGGGYKPRADGLGSPAPAGTPIGFNPGNTVLDFFSQSVVGSPVAGFAGFLPDNRAPRIVREHQYPGVYQPDLIDPLAGDQFTSHAFTIHGDVAFSTAASNGAGEWAGGVLRLRPGQMNQEQIVIQRNTVVPLESGCFHNVLELASPILVPPAVGEAYEVVRAEFFEPDPFSPLDLAVYDPLDPENLSNTDLLNFATIRDRNGVPQDPTAPVDPQSTISFRFSEPMALESFRPYESFYVSDDPPSSNPGINRMGRVVSSQGAKEITFLPERTVQYGVNAGLVERIGFGNVGASLRFHVLVVPPAATVEGLVGTSALAMFLSKGQRGVTDLGGQPLAFPLNSVGAASLVLDYSFAFQTWADATLVNHGVMVHRFQGQPQTGFDIDGKTGVTYRDMPKEITGPNGNLYGPNLTELNLFANGFLAGAPVQFFQKIHDDFNPPPTGQLTAFPFGAASPIGGNAVLGGCRFMHVYRAVDASPDWEALAGTLLDLVGVAYAPSGGAVANTTLPDLSIHAGHTHIVPDTKQTMGIPDLPATGLCGSVQPTVMGGHFSTLGDPTTPYVSGAYTATEAVTNAELRRQLVWGELRPGAQADFYQGREFRIDNANLFVPPGSPRKYHPIPSGGFDSPFPYDNGARDVLTFAETGFGEAPTWGGALGDRKPHSLLLEYRVRVVDAEHPPLTSNGFTFGVGILSSALPRFRAFTIGVNCEACCASGGAASATCVNSCSISQVAADGLTDANGYFHGNPLEPDLVRQAGGPAPAPPGLPCYCLNGPGGPITPQGCPNVANAGASNIETFSTSPLGTGAGAPDPLNNFGDNSRYYMLFNYVKRQSTIRSPFVRVQPAEIVNPLFLAPMFDPPLSELPIGTSLTVRFRASTNGLGAASDSTAFIDVTEMSQEANLINQVPNTPFLQFEIETSSNTETQLNPVIEEIAIPFRTGK